MKDELDVIYKILAEVPGVASGNQNLDFWKNGEICLACGFPQQIPIKPLTDQGCRTYPFKSTETI